jgi:hypothetical protein
MGTWSAAKTNLKKERDGTPLITEYGTFKVRFMGRTSPEYMKAVNRIFGPYQRLIASPEGMPAELKMDLDVQLLSEYGMVGWEDDVTWPVDKEGVPLTAAAASKLSPGKVVEKPLPFSKENAVMMFAALPHVFATVDWGARQPQTFMDWDPEDAVKNSSTS